MKKKKLSIKIIILLVLLVFNCSAFAAIVSDNDGSAFITKAEFDSLKNTFQAQLNNYNENIDSKIDAAISSYLAGIKVDKEVDLSSLINKDGDYGEKIKLSWCSATDFRMISDSYPEPLQHHKWFSVYQEGAFPHNAEIDGNNIYPHSGIWDLPLMNDDGAEVSNYDQGTKVEYRVETIKIGSTNYRMLNLVKVVNIFDYVQFYGFPTNMTSVGSTDPTAVNTGWTAVNFLQENNALLTQKNLLNSVPMDYIRVWNASKDYANGIVSNVSVYKTGSAMITQDYEQFNEHIYAPFSSIQEYVWDPKSEVTMTIPSTTFKPVNTYYSTGQVNWFGDFIDHTRAIAFGLRTNHPKDCYFTWQYLPFRKGEKNESGDNVLAKDSIIYNYYQIDRRNRYQKNGLVLGTTPNKDDVEIYCDCKADVAGTVYFYVGGTIDNWQSSTFDGAKFTLTANTDKKCSLGKIPNTLKNQPIWVLFAPSNTSKTVSGKFKVDRLYYKVAE